MITIKDNSVFIRNIYSVILASLPAIMAIRVPGINKGLATVLLILSVPFPLWRICVGRNFRGSWVLVLFLVWAFIRSMNSMEECICLVLVMIHCLGVLNGALNAKLFRKTLMVVAEFSAALVILQSILYYIFGIPTYLLPKFLLLEDNAYYIKKYFSVLEKESLFRPCALFLEPAHFTQYSIAGLVASLFWEKGRKKWVKVILISVGCILTTSGMGIAMVIGAYGWYFLFAEKEKYTRLPSFVLLFWVGIIAFAILMEVPFFHDAVMRVVGHESNGYNAIWGRVLYWDNYVSPLKGLNLAFGKGFQESYTGYVTSAISLIYSYGLFGTLAYLGAVSSFSFYSKDSGTYFLGFLYMALLFISNSSGFISMVYWFSLLSSARFIGTEKEKSTSRIDTK